MDGDGKISVRFGDWVVGTLGGSRVGIKGTDEPFSCQLLPQWQVYLCSLQGFVPFQLDCRPLGFGGGCCSLISSEEVEKGQHEAGSWKGCDVLTILRLNTWQGTYGHGRCLFKKLHSTGVWTLAWEIIAFSFSSEINCQIQEWVSVGHLHSILELSQASMAHVHTEGDRILVCSSACCVGQLKTFLPWVESTLLPPHGVLLDGLQERKIHSPEEQSDSTVISTYAQLWFYLCHYMVLSNTECVLHVPGQPKSHQPNIAERECGQGCSAQGPRSLAENFLHSMFLRHSGLFSVILTMIFTFSDSCS